MARPKKQDKDKSKRVNLMITPDALIILMGIPNYARSRYVCELIINNSKPIKQVK